MLELDQLLRRAATPEGWARVVQRCAWCQRVFDERGVRDIFVVADDVTVVTDGMCPPCGLRALARVGARSRVATPLAA